MASFDDFGALPRGTVLHDRYRVEDVLGAGAFGITYRATDTLLGRFVAIKELYPEEYRLTREGTEVSVPLAKQSHHQHLIERVAKQGILLRKLDHPHLMDVYEAFKAHNTAYLVAEHLKGETLWERLSERGTLLEEEVSELINNVGDGLHHMHEAGALHLDVKPPNIVCTSGGYVLIDYGAGRMDREAGSIQLSAGGFTEAYAAIEQKDDALEKGPYTDLYALGVTAYECLTGKRPPTYVARGMGKRLVWPDGLKPAMQDLLEAALRVNPEDRPATVQVWMDTVSAADLRKRKTGEDSVVEPPTEIIPPVEEPESFDEGGDMPGVDVPDRSSDSRPPDDRPDESPPKKGKPRRSSRPFLIVTLLLAGVTGVGTIAAGPQNVADWTHSLYLTVSDGVTGVLERDENTLPESAGSQTSEKSEAERNRSPSNTDLIARGDSLRDRGRPQDAIGVYNRVFERDSSSARAWLGRGLAFAQQGRVDSAVSSLDRGGVGIDPPAEAQSPEHRRQRAQGKRLNERLRNLPNPLTSLLKVQEFSVLRDSLVAQRSRGLVSFGESSDDFLNPTGCYIFVQSGNTDNISAVLSTGGRRRVDLRTGQLLAAWDSQYRDRNKIWVFPLKK
jgi:serine/threonine protein kinase